MKYHVSLRINGSVGMTVSAASEAGAKATAESRLADDISKHLDSGSYDVKVKEVREVHTLPRKRRRSR